MRDMRYRVPSRVMIALVLAVNTYLRAFFISRHRLGLEAAALRQQLAVFKRKQSRARLPSFDRFFWSALRRSWTGWASALIIVKADTVISWHRAGFRLFWRLRSRRLGRPKKVSPAVANPGTPNFRPSSSWRLRRCASSA